MTRYYPGSTIRVTFALANLDGEPADPATLVVQHENPAGVKTTLDPFNPSVGVYYVDYTFVAADAEGSGFNEFEVVGTGAVSVADKKRVKVFAL